MGIVAIVDILITASSVQVQVELHATQVVEYTDIWCSAYPFPPAGADPIDTIHHVHMLNPQNDLNIMPPLLVDAFGIPLATESPYWIVCHADELTYGIVHHHLLQTIVTTHTPDGCHTEFTLSIPLAARSTWTFMDLFRTRVLTSDTPTTTSSRLASVV